MRFGCSYYTHTHIDLGFWFTFHFSFSPPTLWCKFRQSIKAKVGTRHLHSPFVVFSLIAYILFSYIYMHHPYIYTYLHSYLSQVDGKRCYHGFKLLSDREIQPKREYRYIKGKVIKFFLKLWVTCKYFFELLKLVIKSLKFYIQANRLYCLFCFPLTIVNSFFTSGSLNVRHATTY